MQNNVEQLKNLKRKVLDKKNKIESMVFELREINERLNEFSFPEEKDYTSNFDDLNKSIMRLTGEINKIKTFDKVEVTNIDQAKSNDIIIPDFPKEIKISNLKDIPKTDLKVEEKVIEFPEEFKVSNLKEIKFPEIKIEKTVLDFPEEFKISNLKEIEYPKLIVPSKINIDWENFPKQKQDKAIDVKSPINNLLLGISNLFKPFFDKIYSFVYNVETYIKEPDKIVITDTLITEYYGKNTKKYRIKKDNNKIEIFNES